MKKKLIGLACVILLVFTGCYPSHTVDITVDLNEQYEGELNIAFSIAGSATGDYTLEQVQTTLISELQASGKYDMDYVASSISDTELTISYTKPFADKEELQTLLETYYNTPVIIEEVPGEDPILNEKIIEGLEISADDFVSFIYDAINEKQLFGSNSSTIESFGTVTGTIVIDGKDYASYDTIAFEDPLNLQSINTVSSLNKKQELTTAFEFVFSKDDALFNAETIEAYFQTFIDDQDEALGDVSLDYATQERKEIFTITIENADPILLNEFSYQLLGGSYDVSVISAYEYYYTDMSEEERKSYAALGEIIPSEKDAKNRVSVEIDYDYSNSKYYDILDNADGGTSTFALGNYRIKKADGEDYTEDTVISGTAVEDGKVIVSSPNTTIIDLELEYYDVVTVIISIAWKIALGIVAIAAIIAGVIFFSKNKKKKQAITAASSASEETVQDEATESEATGETKPLSEPVPEQQEAIQPEVSSEAAAVAVQPEHTAEKPAASLQRWFKQLGRDIVIVIKQKETYYGIAVFAGCWLLLSFLISLFLKSSGLTGEFGDIESMIGSQLSKMYFILSLYMVAPLGIVVTSSEMAQYFNSSTMMHLSAPLLLWTIVLFVLVFVGTKGLFKALHVKNTRSQLFARYVIVMAAVTVLLFIAAIIPISLGDGVHIKGQPFNAFFSVMPIGLLIAFITSFGLKIETYPLPQLKQPITYLVEKVVIFTVVTAVFLLIFGLKEKTFIYIQLLGNAIPYIVMMGLGGSLHYTATPGTYYAAFGAEGVTENAGLFVTSSFNAWFILLLVVVVFLMFFDLPRLKKHFKAVNSIIFALVFAGVLTMILYVWTLFGGVVISIPILMTMTLGASIPALLIVFILSGLLAYGVVEWLVKIPLYVSLLDTVEAKVEQPIIKGLTGLARRCTFYGYIDTETESTTEREHLLDASAAADESSQPEASAISQDTPEQTLAEPEHGGETEPDVKAEEDEAKSSEE